MWGTVKIGRIFTPVHRNFIDDGNFQAWQVGGDLLLIEGVEDNLVRLAGYRHHLGLGTEGDVRDGVRVVVQTDLGSQGDRFVFLEQLLRPEPVDVLHVGVCAVPEPQTAVRVSRHQELRVTGGWPAPLLPTGHRPVPGTPARAPPSPAGQTDEALDEVPRDVRHVVAAGHRALLQVHCIGILKAGEAGGLAVDGHQVVSEEDQDRLGVGLVTPPGRVSLADEVHHAELHLEDGGVLPLQHRHAGLGARHVLWLPAAEYETTLSVPGNEPLDLGETGESENTIAVT